MSNKCQISKYFISKNDFFFISYDYYLFLALMRVTKMKMLAGFYFYTLK